jgi:AcrR family transcriptional regulator
LDVTVASQRRRQIIEAARACITEDGVEKLTLRKVGERAQVSHATIAYYFKTRKELIDSALLEISDDFLDVLRQRHLLYGMGDLVDLFDTFLDPDNTSARFVVQMIDAGLHDVELRSTHDEFIRYGRDRIERSIRVAMEMGDLRRDVDPVLAAALVHTVLIWWQSEIAAGATSRELALPVGKLLLHMLGSQASQAPSGGAGDEEPAPAHEDVPEREISAISPMTMIEASLVRDPNLTTRARLTLMETFKSLYQMAADLSKGETQS